MREKVNQAAKGIFEYSSSALNITPEELSVKVNAGEYSEGLFVVSNGSERPMKGEVSTDCHFLEFKDYFFDGAFNEIQYIFHGESLLPGDTVKGNITVITDYGIKKLSFFATAGVPSCEASSGKIRDLFHFTNLAREHPEEAATLFRKHNFEEIFLYRDNANIALYRGDLCNGMADILEDFRADHIVVYNFRGI